MKEIHLTKNQISFVDDADYASVKSKNWGAHKYPNSWYASSRINGKTTGLHSFLLKPPAGFVVDHIDGNGLNNQRSNLRIATPSENMRNQRRHADSASKYKGVWKVKDCNRWAVRLWDGTKRHYVGLFKDEIEAAKTYDFIANQVFGAFAHLNFPTLNQGVAK